MQSRTNANATSSKVTAGIGLSLLTIAVTPANIYMLQRSELFNIPYWILIVRLPLQVVLLALIWWGTTPARARNRSRIAVQTGAFRSKS